MTWLPAFASQNDVLPDVALGRDDQAGLRGRRCWEGFPQCLAGACARLGLLRQVTGEFHDITCRRAAR